VRNELATVQSIATILEKNTIVPHAVANKVAAEVASVAVSTTMPNVPADYDTAPRPEHLREAIGEIEAEMKKRGVLPDNYALNRYDQLSRALTNAWKNQGTVPCKGIANSVESCPK
jgi:hypothetical protein